jgi:hypothetical protein
MEHIRIQKLALIAYRAKVVAVMNILEGALAIAADQPSAQSPRQKSCDLRKPVAAEGLCNTTKKTA